MQPNYLRPSNEEFEDSYAQAGLQPSTGSRGVISHTRVEYTNRTNKAKMQVGAKAMKVAGKGMTRAGAAVSRTGVGAVVGVPLMAVGATTQVAGAATQAASKVPVQTGRTLQRPESGTRALPLRRLPTIRKSIIGKAKATRATWLVLSWAVPLWFTVQLPLALLTVVTFGASEAAASVLPDWLVEWTAGNLLILLQMAVFLIGLATLVAMAVIYSLNRVNCFFGEGVSLKVPAFCLAVVFYMLPFVSLFPWFLFWALAVWRYPK